MHQFVMLACCFIADFAVAAAPPDVHAHPLLEVLPDTVEPTHYDLTVSPDAEALIFHGRVAITVEVHALTPVVTLNALGLTFDHVTIDGGSDATVKTDEKLGRATLNFSAPVPPGRHTLSIEYHGKISRTTTGFFAMDYSSPDGPRRTLATNFEPAEARKLLPCWDEPGRKATFAVSVDAPKDRMALSNMPIADATSLSSTMQRVHFAQSPKMSTYLLFLSVGDYERVHRQVDGVDVGIVVKRGDTAKAAYALDQASTILRYYNDYFDVPYPLPKLDMIAAPGQIDGGAMENWGAIFYSQDHLLFDPKTSTEGDRQGVFLALSHEMAHQWFGDLVTMKWWSSLWLNEGFARWMQTFAADDLHPEWETGLQAAVIFEYGKQADSVPSTHPVVQPVFTADQATQSFDSITYDKGAAIITMINAYVGRHEFRAGVRRYMKAHAYGSTADNDLWSIMQQAVGKPIVGIVRDFTHQEGLPLVRMSRTAGSVRLALTRFAEDPATLKDHPRQRWRLPLTLGPVNGMQRNIELLGTTDLTESGPLLVNAGQLSYARTLYSPDSFEELLARASTLKPADQLGLLNDGLSLGLAGYAPASNVLRLVTTLPIDASPIVWQQAVRILVALDRHYADTAARASFRNFALDVLAPINAQIGQTGVPNESSNVAILRGALMEARGAFGDTALVTLARQRLETGTGEPAEQRSALSVVATQSDQNSFDKLLAHARSTADPLEKQHYFSALAGVVNPVLARRMIDVALSDQVPAGTAPELISSIAEKHPDLVWEVIAPQLDDPILPFDKYQRWGVAGTIAGDSAKSQRIADLEAYEIRSVPVEARKPFLAAIAAIRRNQRIEKDVLPEIDRWIASRKVKQTARR